MVAVVANVLPGPAAITPRASAATSPPTSDICFLDSNGQRVCPPAAAWPQPPLLNPAVYDAATPAEAQALRDTEDQALANTLADHDLPATDLPQVKSYARSDAQAEMWALIVEALKAPAGQRTQTQQGLVDWMSDQYTQQRFQPAANAALEYARFAGMDLGAARSAVYNDSEQQLTDFLSAPAEPFDNGVVDALDPRPGGYCQYHPPSPYTGEYDEHTLQTCFTPCQSPFGCAPPTPTYDDFVKWGQATYDPENQSALGMMSTPSFANTSAAIALGTVYGSMAVAEGIVLASATVANAAIAGSALAAAVFPFAALDTEAAFIVVYSVAGIFEYTPTVGAAAATALGGAIAVVVAAIAIAAVVGIQVANIDQLPGKLAALVVQSRARVDASTLVDDSSGASTLFSLFAAATLPVPKTNDPTCDPSGISQTAYNYRKLYGGVIEYWPLGSDQARIFDVPHCLNPVPVRPVAADDPHFVVTNSATGNTSDSPDITVADTEGNPDVDVRVSGNWFVEHAVGNGTAGQSLALKYTDWDGNRRVAWLHRTDDGGYEFSGIRAVGGSLSVDRDTCPQDGTCFQDSELHYLGPDGVKYSAHLAPYVPPAATTVPSPTGQPGFSAAFSGQAVTFASGGFAPANAVGPMTYQWHFQKDGCGAPCTVFNGERFVPDYGDPVSGPSATHTWQTSAIYSVALVATDSTGQQAVTTFEVQVKGVAPTVVLAKDCRTLAVPVGCNNYPTSAGDVMNLFGGVELAGTLDRVQVWVDWGDGTHGSMQAAGDHSLHVDDDHLSLTQQDAHTLYLQGTHTYAEPGYYHVTVLAVNQATQSDSKSLEEIISGPQQISFAALPDRKYGESFDADATGTDSGLPVTYTAGPAGVCTSSDDGVGSRISLVGVGTCTVTAHQQGEGPVYQDAAPVSRSFDVDPAPLLVTADDKTKTYGDANPEFTARIDGLRNGDKKSDLAGLTIQGPPADSGVGHYEIVPSGVTDPNYEVDYRNGNLDITKAPLVITPDDQTRHYGDALPSYTASFDGLVNDDTAADITGLRLTGPAQDVHVGTYDIRADSAQNPNYNYIYRHGTETVTPAPLKVTADDVTRRYGSPPHYTASYDGLVNGETSLRGLTFTGAPSDADVGDYPITAVASDSDYDLTLVDGTEHVTPAPLTIKAADKSRIYGGAGPTYTANVTGLTNGDTQADLVGLTMTGAPAMAGAGNYPITPSGVTDPNYDITYLAGTETVSRAPLTITADPKSKTYGASDPAFTASFDGLVNGDTESAIRDLEFAAAPTGSDVGTYAIKPQHATSPNYDITFVDGVESITPAGLTIRAEDKKVRYGAVATYTWRGIGWVNGDSDATIETQPACGGSVQGEPASVTTPPGSYAGAITCSDAADPNYTIGYVAGRLTIDPLVRLAETGLPGTVPHLATMDGATVTLPTRKVRVAFGTSHSWAFPGVVVNANGVTYLTRTPAFSGPVGDNAQVTASYATMSAVLSAAVASGGVDQRILATLTSSWNKVQSNIKSGKQSKAVAAVKDFAGTVRAQSGKKIQKATADELLAYAQLVYSFVGGKGSV